MAELDTELSFEPLLKMTPVINGQDIVCIASRHLLLSHCKSQSTVAETFFPEHRSDHYESKIDPNWFDFETFGTVFVCQALCKNEDEFGIHTLLNEEKVDAAMEEIYNSPDWKKIGFSLYTLLFRDLVKDTATHIPFRAYMDTDRRYWAGQLAGRMKNSKWLYSIVRPVLQGQYTQEDYNRDINILFIKLHLLDPSTVMPTYHHVRKALPDLNLELVTTNYLGGPLDWSLIRPDIQAAVERPIYAQNASKWSMQELELYYGINVIEFIMQEPKELGLYTGKYPDNKRISQFKDRCVVM